MINIDGSHGEGGGQVLRSALSLSIVTNQPFRIVNVRANRSKPGLKTQHLMSVLAATEISNAAVSGAALNSKEITFYPEKIRSGNYKFEIGTAGSVSLVLQTLYLPLAMAGASSTIKLTGGTHVPFSPSFHFLNKHWLYFIKKMGINLSLLLNRAGFYPKGGGDIFVQIEAIENLSPLNIIKRGRLKQIEGLSIICNLNPDVDRRQKERLELQLKRKSLPILLKSVKMQAVGSNAISFLTACFEDSQIVSESLGAKGKPVEKVADEAVSNLIQELATGSTMDVYLADQLMLPLSFIPQKSEMIVSRITKHIATLRTIIQMFVPAKIDFTPTQNGVKVQIKGVSIT